MLFRTLTVNKNQSVDLMAPCLKPGKNSLANFVGESLMKFINWQETDKKKKKKLGGGVRK